MIKKVQNKKKIKFSFIPIILLLSMVPLLTRLNILKATEEVALIHKQTSIADFFAYYKASFILILGLSMLIITFFTFSKQELKKYKDLKIYTYAAGAFVLFTLLATLFSPYKSVALWGIPGRMEGFFVIFTYILMMVYAINTVKEVKDFKVIVYSLGFLVMILTLLGLFEYKGQNLLTSTEWGKNLLFPQEYAQYKQNLRLEYTHGKVYGTLYHYNYMGSFAALTAPLFGTLSLGLISKKEKIYVTLLTLASLFLLFGSTSRGGLIGVSLAIIIGSVILSKILFKQWKVALAGIFTLVIVIIGFNSLTQGAIFERLPALIQDIQTAFIPSDIDYKDFLPIKEVEVKENEVTLVTQKNALTLKNEETLKFYDKEGQEVIYIEDENEFTTVDEDFKTLKFKKLYTNSGTLGAVCLNSEGIDSFIFKLDIEGEIYPIDSYTQQKEKIIEAESWGFKGKERLGSSRGYIWSRSLPMLKKTWFIGHGPDTYSLDFPQNDYLAKWYAYGTPHMIVDKPHNLYLQIGINEGVIALGAFLVLVMTYIVESLRLYAFRKNYEKGQIIGVATLLSIIGYLGAGVFNDSVVAVAPIFWILLGIGISMNQINKGTNYLTK